MVALHALLAGGGFGGGLGTLAVSGPATCRKRKQRQGGRRYTLYGRQSDSESLLEGVGLVVVVGLAG